MSHVHARPMYSSCRIFLLPCRQVASSPIIILNDMIWVSLLFQLKMTNKLKLHSLTVDTKGNK